MPDLPFATPIRSAAVVLIAFCGPGCMPAINHGPRVIDGSNVAVITSVSQVSNYHIGYSDDATPFGPTGLSIGRGWAAENENVPGYFLGVHLSLMGVHQTHGDFYVQMPGTYFEGLDAGFGFALGPTIAMPYVQFGRTDVNGAGLYMTPGILFTRSSPYDTMRHSEWAAVTTINRVWASSSGRQRHVFLTVGFGGRRSSCAERGSMCQEQPDAMGPVGAIGVAFDLLRWGRRDQGQIRD